MTRRKEFFTSILQHDSLGVGVRLKTYYQAKTMIFKVVIAAGKLLETADKLKALFKTNPEVSALEKL